MDVFAQYEQCLVTQCMGMQHPTEGTMSLLTLKNYLSTIVVNNTLPYLRAEIQVPRSKIIFPQLVVSKRMK